MIRTILTPVFDTNVDDASFSAAFAIAQKFSAHLEFLHVRRDLASEIVGIGDMGVAGISHGLITSVQQVETDCEMAAKEKVEQLCEHEGIKLAAHVQPHVQAVSARWICETGDLAEWVIRYGQTAELLVIPRPEENSETAALAEATLISSGRPIYIPGPVPVRTDTVVIAWKPTPQAARAVGAALPFLTAARRVVVLTIEEGEPRDPNSTARLLTTLRRHHLVVEARQAEPDGKTPQERLLIEATWLGAELLVMGGYGHSRLREWILGGFTEHVLSRAPLPVLMSH